MTGDPNVTQLLEAAGAGDAAAAEEILPAVYDELRRLAAAHLARERPGQTIQATALVHEAYLRLVGDEQILWEGRRHFFGAAARAMRRILVERARRRLSGKHGGGRARLDLDDLQISGDDRSIGDFLALEQALEKLADMDPRKGEIVMLRYFAGLSIAQTAEALDLSRTVVKDEWQFARAWLYGEIRRHDGDTA